MFDFPYDNLISERRVICGVCALGRSGLTTYDMKHLDLFSPYPEVDGVSTVYISYYYKKNIDYDHWVFASESNPLLLQPTKERALVEYILNEKWLDEGVLLEAINDYIEYFPNHEKLYEVADFFKLSREVLNYWICEAINDGKAG
jgi:hypothetical protein